MSPASFIESVYEKALNTRASDVHISPGVPVAFRIRGGIVFDTHIEIPQAGLIRDLLNQITSPAQKDFYNKGNELDLELISQKGKRFRINIFQDRRGDNIALRHLPQEIPSLDNLGLPKILRSWLGRSHGLILICGASGSGKTTTRSALIEYVNQTDTKHIVVLEDVIEHVYENKESLIRQRRVGHDGHTRTYPQAVSAAMREDPDIISVGDLRDSKTIDTALQAAQTGHLVLAEIHASTTFHAISRIISSFSQEDQVLAREILAQQFIGAIALRLVLNSKTGERELVYELLSGSTAVKTALRKNNMQTLADIVVMNREEGSIPLDESLG